MIGPVTGKPDLNREAFEDAKERLLDAGYDVLIPHDVVLPIATHEVLDADGVPIKVGDTVYCDGDPEPLTVDSFDDPGFVYLTSAKGSDGTLYTIEPSLLTHKRPDSWERIEEDVYHLVMSEYLETPEKDVSDLVRRAKALAKAGEGE